jgi:hypothetical protein
MGLQFAINVGLGELDDVLRGDLGEVGLEPESGKLMLTHY